jgi:hypothetical protein
MRIKKGAQGFDLRQCEPIIDRDIAGGMFIKPKGFSG